MYKKEFKLKTPDVIAGVLVVSCLLAASLPNLVNVEKRKVCSDMYGAAQRYVEGSSTVEQSWGYQNGECILTQTTVSRMPGG